MRTQDIVQVFQTEIVKSTSFFNDSITDISSATVTGSTVTANTVSAHGLTTGQLVLVTDSNTSVDNPITSATQAGQNIEYKTSLNHDLTENFQKTVELSGFTDAGWNGTATLVEVPNRKTFRVSGVGKPALPTLNSSELLEEARSVGPGTTASVAVTVVTANQFTYDAGVDLTGLSIQINEITTRLRVSGSIDLPRAAASYSRQDEGKFWAFVVTEAGSLSKARTANSDADAEEGVTTARVETFLEAFSLYIFAPTASEIAAVKSLDICRHDLFGPIARALRGVNLATGLNQGSTNRVSLIGHNLEAYDESKLVYRYSFQFPVFLNQADQNTTRQDVAFRDISLTVKDVGGLPFGTKDINLDETPL